MAIMLKISLVVAGLLLIPPVLTIALMGPLEGGQELVGKDKFSKADLESELLRHVFWIDCGKNLVLALLCFSAVLFFDTGAQKVTAVLMILMDFCAAAAQVAAPVGGVKPWPALDGLFSNPIVLPIIGGQIVLLTLGLLTSVGESKVNKSPPKKSI